MSSAFSWPESLLESPRGALVVYWRLQTRERGSFRCFSPTCPDPKARSEPEDVPRSFVQGVWAHHCTGDWGDDVGKAPLSSLPSSAIHVREMGSHKQLSERFKNLSTKQPAFPKAAGHLHLFRKDVWNARGLCNLWCQNNGVNWVRRVRWLIVILLLNPPHLKKSLKNSYRCPSDWFQATFSTKHNISDVVPRGTDIICSYFEFLCITGSCSRNETTLRGMTAISESNSLFLNWMFQSFQAQKTWRKWNSL